MLNKHISTPKQIRQWRLEILTFLLIQFWWHCYHIFIVVIITNLSHLIVLSSHWHTPHISYLIKDSFIFIIWICNSSHIYVFIYTCMHIYVKSGDCNLWDLIPDNVGWNRWNNNRSKVHNTCNVLELPEHHPPTLIHRKIIFHKTWCQNVWGQLC